jgi:hypothetical protein
MLTDSKLAFVLPGNPLSFIGGVDVASPLIIDLLGNGVGQPPASIIGNKSVFGVDAGVGDHRPEIDTVIGDDALTSSSATLNIALQGAVDTGAGGGYQPGTWTTIVETGPLAAATLISGYVAGRFPFLPYPTSALPRYLRILFQVATGTFTQGSIAFSVVTFVRDDNANKYAASNFSVTS